jgi:hypothetical protein
LSNSYPEAIWWIGRQRHNSSAQHRVIKDRADSRENSATLLRPNHLSCKILEPVHPSERAPLVCFTR